MKINLNERDAPAVMHALLDSAVRARARARQLEGLGLSAAPRELLEYADSLGRLAGKIDLAIDDAARS